MSEDKYRSMKDQAAKRLAEATQRLGRRLEPSFTDSTEPEQPIEPRSLDRIALQAATLSPFEQSQRDAGALGDDETAIPPRPAAPVGSWRCIVSSKWVSIDLVANIAEDESLTAQGTLIYPATNKMFQVSGSGNWLALPPDDTSSNWLFQFRLQPSNHAIFSWFAGPTDSPNHLYNRFVSPNSGNVVETHCERQG
ncbi:MAG: hypothetical protein ACX94B_16615 [Henriciella sp.]